MNLFFSGLITGASISIGAGIAEWRRLNKVAEGKYRRLQVTGRNKVINCLKIVGLIALVTFLIIFLLVKTGIRIREYYPFLSGLFLFAWTQYLVVAYWERKNRKILISDRTGFYTVDESR
ncbi:MAG: DUF1673 family protein [Candidatus Methanoperedens sp.]|nr:DUF1673 family protein [Candidatus Methanoperedens sp.]